MNGCHRRANGRRVDASIHGQQVDPLVCSKLIPSKINNYSVIGRPDGSRHPHRTGRAYDLLIAASANASAGV